VLRSLKRAAALAAAATRATRLRVQAVAQPRAVRKARNAPLAAAAALPLSAALRLQLAAAALPVLPAALPRQLGLAAPRPQAKLPRLRERVAPQRPTASALRRSACRC
jgi:hypothetical protein